MEKKCNLMLFIRDGFIHVDFWKNLTEEEQKSDSTIGWSEYEDFVKEKLEVGG